jgi:hypothetical protein
MSTIDDFFGDSKTAKKECLYCGKSDGILLVAVEDANGPTHWEHGACKKEAEAKREKERLTEEERVARNIWIANTDN